MQNTNFEEWYHSEWIQHVKDEGGIKSQLKTLTWLVSALLASQLVTVGFLITILKSS